MTWEHWRGRVAIWAIAAAWVIVLAGAIAPRGTVRAQGQDDLARLRTEVSLLHGQGRYAEAIPIAERYVALARQQRGEGHTELATALSWLAYVYRAQGRYAEAEPAYWRSLVILEKALGPAAR